jgi:gamma-aminobutyric acid type B receptor
VREEVIKYFTYICGSEDRSITLGVLYGYKILPQMVALIFAFTIRKIQIKGLNDAKYIAFAVYISSLVTTIVIVINFTLKDFINAFATIFSTGFFIGNTAIILLILMPPVSCLYH